MSSASWLRIFLPLCAFLTIVSSSCDSSVIQASFTQLSGCSEDYIASMDIMRAKTRSVMDCARLCAETSNCFSFDHFPENTSWDYNNCGLATSKPTNCSELFFHAGAKHYQNTKASCNQPWKKVLSQQNGTITGGSISSLIDSVQQGSPIRVLVEADIGDYNEVGLYGADSAWVINGTVIVSVFTFSYYHQGESSLPLWTKMQISTTGVVTEVMHNVGPFEYLANIQWFIKETELKCGRTSSIVLEIEAFGIPNEENVDEIISTIKEGYPLQMIEESEENGWRSFPVSKATVNGINSFVIHGVWVDSSLQSSSLVSQTVLFQNMPTPNYVYFSNLDIMDPTKLPQGAYYDVNIKWAVDYCWEKIYVNDDSGFPEFGWYYDLFARLNTGSDLRVVYQCSGSTELNAISIDHVTVSEEMISANAANSFSSPPVAWIRTQIHTNGTINEISLDRTTGFEFFQSCQGRISWFVDKTERQNPWFYYEEFMLDSAEHSSFPLEYFYKGLLPHILVVEEMYGNVEAYSIQKVSFLPIAINPFGMNYRTFNGSSLAVTSFDVYHYVNKNKIKIDVSPGPLNESSSKTSFQIDWYI